MLKKTTVVMLPTNEKAQLWKDLKGELYFEPIATGNLVKNANQYLYFLSDEEIKEGDWYLTFDGAGFHRVIMMPRRCEDENYSFLYCKKIIATTDSSLQIKLMEPHKDEFGDIRYNKFQSILPQPSQSFLEVFVKEYNKGNIIKEVMVEYDIHHGIKTSIEEIRQLREENGWDRKLIDEVLKVNPKDNTITIKRVKDSWNREEVEILINSFYSQLLRKGLSDEFPDKFIEQNL